MDYEKGDYGEFLRYGIGGELQNRYVAFAANLYLPITDDKHTGSTVAFSQKGYDANLRINIPQLDFLKVRADYYHFDGKYGGENDNGFRYGLELQPINNLRIGAFYDDGGEKFGGDIAYIYNISPPQKRESTGFAPDLFSPVVREYSQRIITATTGPQIQVLRIPTLTTFMVSVISAITTTTTMTTPHLEEITTMPVNSRAASVLATTSYFHDLNAVTEEVTTTFRFLITLPPLPDNPPIVVRINRNLGQEVIDSGISNRNVAVAVEDNLGAIIGGLLEFPNRVQNYDLTVIIGSEQFVVGLMTITTITDGMTTETPTIILARTITSAMTAFLTTTMTIGAAIDNSRHLPAKAAIHPRHSRENGNPFPSFSRPKGAGIQHSQRRAVAAMIDGRLCRREFSAAKPPRIRRGFYIPVILATAGIHPFAILLFARKRKRRFIAENGKPLRRQSRRKFPPPLAAQNSPPCGELIPAYAGMTKKINCHSRPIGRESNIPANLPPR